MLTIGIDPAQAFYRSYQGEIYYAFQFQVLETTSMGSVVLFPPELYYCAGLWMAVCRYLIEKASLM